MKRFVIYSILIIFSACIFLLVLKGVGGNPSASSLKAYQEYSLRDRGRYLLTQKLIVNHTFALTREEADIAAPDVGYSKGDWYELYPPGQSLIAIPFYLLGQKFNMSLVFSFGAGGVFAIGTIILIVIVTRKVFKLPLWAGIFAGLIYGFACTSLGYATSLFQHQTTAFFILSGFYAVYEYNINQRWGFLWGIYVWIAYSIAIVLDYPNAVLMFPVILYFIACSVKITFTDANKYVIKFRTALIFTSIVFLGASALHGYYNKIHFGSATRLSGSLAGFYEGVNKVIDKGGSQADVDKIVNEAQTRKAPVKFFGETKILKSGQVLLTQVDRGLFVYSPIFILALFGMFLTYKKMDLEKMVMIGLVVANLFVYASWGDPWAGWSFGPRYLISSMPILAIFVAYFITQVNYKRTAKFTALILFIISAGIAILGATTTNAVPPQVEAIRLQDTRYGLRYNLDFIKEGKTSSYLYNSYFHDHITLIQYWAIIFTAVIIAGFIALYILPKFEKNDDIN